MKPNEIQHAVVVGTGQMGPGIAYTLASAGCTVTILGRTTESMEKGLNAFQTAVNLMTEERIISDTRRSAISEKISGSTDLESAVSRADLVTESIVEDINIKQELFARIENLCQERTLLTSNTSGLPATQIAGVLRFPQRFAVTHFWNPPHLMPLVEVVKGEKTVQETIDTLMSLLKKGDKRPVAVLKDTPGQLGNRLFHALIREGYYIVQEGIATAEDVDTAASFGFGRRLPAYGMLAHQDAVGLDMVYAIQQYMCKALCNDTVPSHLLEERVSSGHLGVKSGSGYFDWTTQDIRAVREKRDRFLIELLKSEMGDPG